MICGSDNPLLDKESGMFLLSDVSERKSSEMVSVSNVTNGLHEDGKRREVVVGSDDEAITARTPSHETC